MKPRLYRVILSLDPSMEGRANLTVLTRFITAARNEFNAKSDDKKVYIIGIYPNFISLIVSMCTEDDKIPAEKDLSKLVAYVNAKCFDREKIVKLTAIRDMETNGDTDDEEIASSLEPEALKPSVIERIVQEAVENVCVKINEAKQCCLVESANLSKTPSQNLDSNPSFSNSIVKTVSLARWAGPNCAFLEKQLVTYLGSESAKESIRNIARFIKNTLERYKALNAQDKAVGCNTVICGNKGSGKDTTADILYNLYYNLGLIKSRSFIKIEGNLLKSANRGDEINIFRGSIGKAYDGVIYLNEIDITTLWDNERCQRVGCSLQGLIDAIEMYRDKFVFIISCRPESLKNLMESCYMKNLISFEVNLPDLCIGELIECGKQMAKDRLYTIDCSGQEELRRDLNYHKAIGEFQNMYTVKNLIDRAITKRTIRIDFRAASADEMSILTAEDFYCDKILGSRNEDPFKELDSMIGMDAVKDRVREIASYVRMQRKRQEICINTEPLCLHLAFSGNPGTGKTTVARIISKVFIRIGALKKDKFVESCRDDLVGKYIGHSEAKTIDRINEAMGGTLFIDEADSLENDSERDYGKEIVSTIVKRMEDDRDKFCVIFAGLSINMDKFINSNPGLKSRLQFIINFPDYRPDELMKIFIKFCSDQKYTLEDKAEKELSRIFKTIYKNRDKNFSNGRLVRQCFDRVKIRQSMRIIADENMPMAELMRITVDDVKYLYKDEDIKKLIEGNKDEDSKRAIGF